MDVHNIRLAHNMFTSQQVDFHFAAPCTKVEIRHLCRRVTICTVNADSPGTKFVHGTAPKLTFPLAPKIKGKKKIGSPGKAEISLLRMSLQTKQGRDADARIAHNLTQKRTLTTSQWCWQPPFAPPRPSLWPIGRCLASPSFHGTAQAAT